MGTSLFANQIAVVTGASSGIGKAIALGLAAQQATVCAVGRNITLLEAAPGTRIRGYQADLAVDDDVRGLAERVARDWGAVDLLIHSAGAIVSGRIADAPVETFDWQYRINVRAPFLLTQALLPFIQERRGQIVFINSTAGLNARGGVGQYAATKFALKAIADSLREEVNGAGVRVLSIYPGRTASPMQAAVHASEGKPYHPERLMQPEDVASVVISALSLPRTAEVTDINIRPMMKT